ncbi:MAG TPA: hypothetical protein V6D00_01855, partial [Pantanalinema sp.]
MKKIFALVALSLTLAACTTPKPNEAPTVTTAAAPKGMYLYVFNGLGHTIDEINLKTREVSSAVIKTGPVPSQFVMGNDTTYLVDSVSASIDLLDLRTRTKSDTINLRTGTSPITLTLAEGKKGLVMHSDFMTNLKEIAWMDLGTKTLEATASVPKLAWADTGCVVANGKVYVPAAEVVYGQPSTESGLYVFDYATRKLLQTLPLEATDNPTAIALDPNGMVEIGVSTGVKILDPKENKVTKHVQLGAAAKAIRFLSADKAYALVEGGLVSFNPKTGDVLRPAANKIAAPTGSSGMFRIFDGAAYVSNFDADTVRVIDLAT